MKTQLPFRVFLAFILFYSNILAQAPQVGWAVHDGGPGSSADIATSITKDGSGNTYITGKVAEYGVFDGQTTTNSIMTTKLDANGSVLWKKYYFNPDYGDAYPVGIAFDGNNGIYVAGNAINASSEIQVVLMKYDLNGTLLWTQIYNDVTTGYDKANGLAVGNGGAAFLALTSQDLNLSDSYFRTIKYNSSGTFQWQKDYNLGFAGNNEALVITADNSGNCYVAGRCKSQVGTNYHNVTIVSYSSGGGVNWSDFEFAQSFDTPTGIIRSAAGNVFVTGGFNNATKVRRYNSSGVLQWSMSTTAIDPALVAHDIAVDPSENAYITGGKYFSGSNDIVTVKFDAAGTPSGFNYAGNFEDMGVSVECDAAGFIYVMGYTTVVTTGQPDRSDYILIKYDNGGTELWHSQIVRDINYDSVSHYQYGPNLVLTSSTKLSLAGFNFQTTTIQDFHCSNVSTAGSLQWTKLISRSKHGYDFSKSSAMDSDRNIYVSGRGEGLDNYSHLYTVKYDKDGVKLWEDYLYTESESHSDVHLAIDDNGNTFVTFYLFRNNWIIPSPLTPAGVLEEMVTVKYNAAGTRMWVHYSQTDVTPADIKTDANGNFYVFGTYNYNPGTDIILYKFDPNGVELWSRTYSWSDEDYAVSLALDVNGKAYAAFTTYDNLGYSDAVVLTWDANGTQDWSSGYLGFGGSPQAVKIMVDANFNTYYFVTSLGGTTNRDLCVQKFDASGSYRLEVRYDGANHDYEEGYDMDIDENGYAYVTGSTYSTNLTDEMVVVKMNLNGVIGSVEWAKIYDSQPSGYDYGTKIAVDWNGNVYACGNSSPANGDGDMITLKYDAAGTEVWRDIFNAPAEGYHTPDGAIFSEGLGEVYISGHGYWDDSTSSDYITYKYCEVPHVSAIGNTTFCQGGSVVLTTDSAYSYDWSNGETTRSITVSAGGTYTVTTNNCANSTAITVTENPLPVVSINPAGTVDICQGESATLTSSAASSYSWLPNGENTSSIQTSVAGSYSVEVTDANGCSNTSASTTVVVHALPGVTISPNNPSPLCEGDTIQLSSTPGSSYLWSPGNETSQQIDVFASGTFSVTLTDANGCTNTSAAVSVTVNPLPVVSFSIPDTLCDNDTLMLSGNPAGGQFSGPGVSNDIFYSANAGGPGMKTITYVYTDPGTSCSNSAEQSVYVDICTGISVTEANSELSVYPNPSNENVFLEFKSATANSVILDILDVTGKLIQRNDLVSSGNFIRLYEIKTAGFANGVYFLKVNSEFGSSFRRILIQH